MNLVNNEFQNQLKHILIHLVMEIKSRSKKYVNELNRIPNPK